MSISNKNPLNKLFKTEAPIIIRQQTAYSMSESLYNINDFLPSTSSVQNTSMNVPQRLKTKSTFSIKAESLNKVDRFLNSNIEQKLIQQKMNKLKQQNLIFKQLLTEQKDKNSKMVQQIQRLNKLINKMSSKQETKVNSLKMWSYKYHIQYNPKQKHKYQLAVQTDDSLYQQTGLKAKDFQDIYKKLNTNPSIIDLNKKGKKQSQNFKLVPDFSMNNNASMTNYNNSTLKYPKLSQQNTSIFKIPKLEDYLNSQNKQNDINRSNLHLFTKNPMEINLKKMFQKQKPIKEECIQIYPIEESYLDGIVGQILCGQQ